MWNKPPQVTMQPKATCTRLAVAPWIHYDQSTKQLYLDLLKVCASRRPSHLSNFVEVNIGIYVNLFLPHINCQDFPRVMPSVAFMVASRECRVHRML